MKKKKSVIMVWLGVLLLCLGNMRPVLAQNTLQIGIDQYEVTDEGKISVFVNKNEAEGFSPSKAESTLMIGKNTLQIEDIKTLQEMKEPVTYLCLVDISGSMTEEGIGETKDVLKQFVEAKAAEDNFCITTMGNDVTSSGFLSDSDKLTEVVDGIHRIGTEDTNLYYSITEALNVLKTDKAVHKKRCLVIFSDGEDDQKKGITHKEAEDAVKESHIPVFTVMLTGNKLKDAEESAKILGSFARNSAGGEHYAPPLEPGTSYEDICAGVNSRLWSSIVVSGRLEEIKEVGDDTVYIGVTLSDGTREASDGITVPAGTILEAIEALDEARKAADVKVTVVNEHNENEIKEETAPREEHPNRLPVIAGAAFALVLILALVVVLLQKRGKEEDDGEQEEWEDSDGREVTEAALNVSYDSVAAAGGQGVTDKVQTAHKKGKDKVRITLFQIGPGETENYQLVVKDRVTIGRDKSCQLCLSNDTALSGRHCSVLYRDGSVYVRDEESTNGTFVNGVPIVGEYKVEMDDILLIGSSEYRITWE
ncbi:MAG: FHA domain-containing protein [Lachnospiraceae bacterium]|nr:FHA domain-containing protein [Lachnospiraceae bacterium]